MSNRMNLKFSPATADRLERLADRMGTSRTGVLEWGIALLDLADKARGEGNAIGVIHGDRVLREVVVLANA